MNFSWPGPWASLLSSIVLLAGYEFWYRSRSRRFPLHFARSTHAQLRARWARELMRTPGSELLAIQTLRNSVMSATVVASTAMLTLMGTVSLLDHAESLQDFTPHTVLVVMLTAFLLSAMAVRFFNHAGYLMGCQAQGAVRETCIELAARYMVRAGNYYSQGMRALLWLTPVVAGLLHPGLMLPATLALLGMTFWFDRSPEPAEFSSAVPPEGQP